jgi:hypothetical protein
VKISGQANRWVGSCQTDLDTDKVGWVKKSLTLTQKEMEKTKERNSYSARVQTNPARYSGEQKPRIESETRK